MKSLALGVTIAALILAGCESTTNSPRRTDSYTLEADEARVWERAREAANQLKAAGYIIDDPEATAYLEAICQRLYPEVGAHPSEFEILILRDPSVNAFTLPNGITCVNSGLLAAMESEAQVAIVLAHELVHFEQRHSLLAFRHLKQQAAFHSVFGVTTLGYGSLLSMVGFPAAISGHSKEAEREADRIGWSRYLAAGYAPSEAPEAFRKLQAYVRENKEKEAYFFGSHPHLQERIDAMTMLAAEAISDGANVDAAVGLQATLGPLRQVCLKNALLDFDLGNLDRVRHFLNRYESLAESAQDADLCYAQAELRRREGGEANRAEAIRLCEMGLAQAPLHAGLLRTLGQLRYERGEWNAAAHALRDAVTLEPAYPRNPFILSYIEKCEQMLSETSL